MREEMKRNPSIDASGAKGLIIGDNATMRTTFNISMNLFRRSNVSLATLADQLATAMQRQWSSEATWRSLHDPYAIPVQWKPADPDLVVSWQSLTKLAEQGAGWPPQPPGSDWAKSPSALAGEGHDLINVLNRIPTGRLAVLGQPGSGKTVLLVRLVLDLLAGRLPGQPVPILIPLASWNPEGGDFYGWIEQWLTTNHPALTVRRHDPSRVTRARALLDAGLIFPLLDGLDEIPSAVASTAISKINSVLQPGQRLVLASRTEAFLDAIRQPSGLEVKLAGAAGIVLCPLEAKSASEYLRDSAGGSASAARWKNVVTALNENPAAPVSQCMKTPLMLSLARTIYNPRPGESEASFLRYPDALLDEGMLPCEQTVREHLFGAYLPASYRPYPNSSQSIEWTSEKAEEWLCFLARDMEYRQSGATDLGWWTLGGAAPRALAGSFVGVSAGIAGALTLPWSGWGIGIICTLIVGLLLRKRLNRPREGLARGLAGGIIGGECAGLLALFFFGAGTGDSRLDAFITGGVAVGLVIAPMTSFCIGLIAAFAGEITVACYDNLSAFSHIRLPIGSPAAYCVNGLALGLAAGLSAGYFNRRLPARGLQWSNVGALIGTLGGSLFAFVLWVTAGPEIGIICGSIAIVVCGFLGGLYEVATPFDLSKATSPETVLAADRRTFFTILALAALISASDGLNTALGTPVPASSPYHGIEYGIQTGIMDLIALGLAVSFFQAMWGSFLLSRLWLGLAGRVPFRTMRFLHDAHVNRGVLRQVGAFYQFRHIELQRYLARNKIEGG